MTGFFSSILNSLKLWLHPTSENKAKELNLKVFNADIGCCLVITSPNDIGLSVKKAMLDIIHREPSDEFDFERMLRNLKLIRIKNKTEIRDLDYLDALNVKNKEEFFLTYRRDFNSFNEFEEYYPVVSEKQIADKTSHLPKLTIKPAFKTTWLLLDDRTRKVFITLAQESAYILGMKPHADKIIKLYRQKILSTIQHNKNAFQVMCQLGFPPNKVEFALKLKANNYRLALDWLIDNVKCDQPSSARSSKISSNRRDSILSSNFESTITVQDRINGLLEIVKFYSEKVEPISFENLMRMVFMGFDVDVSRDALHQVGNNVGAACAHLAGDNNPSIMEIRNGLSLESPIYKKLMESPIVQQLISCPEAFIFLITIIDNFEDVNKWDGETLNGQFMHYVIHLYHEEKHYTSTNQFNDLTF